MKKKKQNSILKESDVKVGTPSEALWTRVRNNTEKRIEELENELEVSRTMLIIADGKIKAEQGK